LIRRFAGSDEVVETEFVFGRHTGVTLEPRRGGGRLERRGSTVDDLSGHGKRRIWLQNIAALHLGLKESQVRVVCKDVGGSFGIKVHIYADEMATYALSKLLRRPVKFVADRVESFNYRHSCARPSLQGKDRRQPRRHYHGVRDRRPYGHRPLFDVSGTSAIEANQVINLVGGPYAIKNYRARAPCGIPEQERHVPVPRRPVNPIACSVTEAGSTGSDEDRHGSGRNPPPPTLIADDAYPCASPRGVRFEQLRITPRSKSSSR